MNDEYPESRPTPLVNRMVNHPKGAYSWHKLYYPELCEEIPKLYEGGKTDAMVAKRIGIAKSTLYDWIKQYPEFAAAVKYGKTIAEDYMTSVGLDAVVNERKINDKVWHTLMRNCYDYDKDLDAIKDDTRSALEKALDKIPDAVK